MKLEQCLKRISSKSWLMTAVLCGTLILVLSVAALQVQAQDPESEIAMWAEIVQMKQVEYARERDGRAWDLRLLTEMALIEAEQYDREVGLSFRDQVQLVRDLFPEQHYTVIDGDPFFLSVKVPATLEGREIDEERAWIDFVFSGRTITVSPERLLVYLGHESIHNLRMQTGGRGR